MDMVISFLTGYTIVLIGYIIRNRYLNLKQRLRERKQNYLMYEQLRTYLYHLDVINNIVHSRFENYNLSIDELTDWESHFEEQYHYQIKILEVVYERGFEKKYRKRVEKGLTNG